ncbi:Hypothetical_protein [Hexamita inflata]|uniref:Hypothetical_protein n=1 Tax=Hexamita inflata TaxID=28002 RepID=A0AA86P994_9EUKA|nr:Hypothetical protein HINF_LOCUS22077 [Hexamita inflata]
MQLLQKAQIPVPKPVQSHSKYDCIKKNVMFNQSQVEESLFDITENSESDESLHLNESNLSPTTELTSCNSSVSQCICWDSCSRQDVVLYTQATVTKQRSLIKIVTKVIKLDQAVSDPEEDMFAFMFNDAK